VISLKVELKVQFKQTISELTFNKTI